MRVSESAHFFGAVSSPVGGRHWIEFALVRDASVANIVVATEEAVVIITIIVIITAASEACRAARAHTDLGTRVVGHKVFREHRFAAIVHVIVTIVGHGLVVVQLGVFARNFFHNVLEAIKGLVDLAEIFSKKKAEIR